MPLNKISSYYVFFVYLFFGSLVFSPFLGGRQRVHDSYLVELYAGYGFMIDGLFNQGRLFSSWFYRALLFFDPPYRLVMAGSTFLSVVFLSAAAFVVYRLVDKENNLLAVIGSFMLFFNLFVLESLLFFENAVMSLGILLAVLAVAAFLADRYWGCLGLMLFSVFCYQPAVAFFPPLLVLFVGFRLDLIRGAFIHGAALLGNFLFLRLVSDDGRFYGEVRLLTNLLNSFTASRDFLVNQYGFMPSFLFLAFLLLFLGLLVYYNKGSLLAFVALFAATFVLLLPMASERWYIFPRSAVGLAGIGGLALVGLALYAERVHRLVILAAFLFLLVVSQQQIRIQMDSFANQHMDMLELAMLGERLRAYEEARGAPIERIYFGYRQPKEWFRPQLGSFNDLTLSMWHVEWMPRPFLWHELGREVPVARIDYVGHLAERVTFADGVIYLVLNNVWGEP